MIISYSIKNYRSYKERQTISFLASPDKPRAKRKSMFLYQDENICLTKLALIYGANATGKSNLFIGLRSFVGFVFSAYPKTYTHNYHASYTCKESFNIPYVPFFGELGEAEHSLEFYSPDQKKSYRYTLIIDDLGILKEALEEQSGPYNPKKYRLVFVRQNDNTLDFKNPNINISAFFNPEFNSGANISPEARDKFVAYVNGEIHHYQSLLYLLMEKSPYPYFQLLSLQLESIKIRFNKMQPTKNTFLGNHVHGHLLERGSVYKTILNFVRISNTAIYDMTVTEEDLLVIHYDYNGHKYSVPFADISEGTKKICYLTRDILTILWEGGTLLGDELDAEIHPFILALIFEVLLAPQYKCQVICTLHTPIVVDLLNRLKNAALPHSMVYFSLKTNNGATELKNYTQFQGKGLMKQGEFINFVVENRYLFAPDARSWMFEDYLTNPDN